jgi:hypothetical protein
MVQEVSLKMQMKFPDAPDVYWESEEFLSNRYHARQGTCAEEKLDKICARLEASPRKSLDSFAQQSV